jgi:hypothetical protein
MLQRSTQVGEFYRMSPPRVWDATKKLPPTYMDIVVYDEEHDKHVHITLLEALLAAGINQPRDAANPHDFFDVDNLSTSDERVLMHLQGSVNYGDAATAVTEIKRLLGSTALGAAGAAQAIVAAVTKGTWLPIEIVIARPFIEHVCATSTQTLPHPPGDPLGLSSLCSRRVSCAFAVDDVGRHDRGGKGHGSD